MISNAVKEHQESSLFLSSIGSNLLSCLVGRPLQLRIFLTKPGKLSLLVSYSISLAMERAGASQAPLDPMPRKRAQLVVKHTSVDSPCHHQSVSVIPAGSDILGNQSLPEVKP